jgi:hypothetical protein
MKVCARYLMPGDVTGSGETVVKVWPAPRGKVLVVTEKNGCRRRYKRNPSTIVDVKRMEQ